MIKKKHKPPSRERYEQNNPNWTVRMPIALHDALEAFLEGSDQSRRDFMAIALEKQEMDYERIRTEGYNEGITDGEIEGYNKGKSDGFIDGKQVGYEEGHQIGYSEGHDQGYSEGYAEGKKKGFDEGGEYLHEQIKDLNKIWYYCVVCGEPIVIKPNSPEHHFIIAMMRYNGWAHPECAQRISYW